MQDAHEIAGLSGAYGLLARIWRREVDAVLLRGLRSEPLSRAWVDAGGVVPAGEESVVLDELAEDYCQLFIGPRRHLPPCQSVWTNGQFEDETTASMRRYLDVLGVPPDFAEGALLDHLGVQLDVMKMVAARSHESTALADLADGFFRDHLRWPGNLLQAAQAKARTAFYQRAIQLTGRFLDSEFQRQRNL